MSQSAALAPGAPKPRSAARARAGHAARAAVKLSPKDLMRVRRMKANGNKMPVRALIAARSVGLPLALACALLEQETGGGANVFGHDPTIFVGAGEERAVARKGALSVVTQMTVTLSTDHRAVDGALGAELMAAFRGFIENPVMMLV